MHAYFNYLSAELRSGYGIMLRYGERYIIAKAIIIHFKHKDFNVIDR